MTPVGQSGRRPAAANKSVGQSGRRPAAANKTDGEVGRRATLVPPETARARTRIVGCVRNRSARLDPFRNAARPARGAGARLPLAWMSGTDCFDATVTIVEGERAVP